ncbi:DUF2155 domain-containing protein [Acetobacter oeni]|nr:DUF2155 domain-containing protein [Acetobacter oeni]
MNCARGAEPLAPPAIYPADTWQGKSEVVLRVLNRLDAHVETIHVPAGGSVHYQNLNIGVARCLENAPTLRTDAAAWVDVQDTRTQGPGFRGWMLAAEPSLGIFENPLYDIRVTGCAGNDVPPALPEPVHPVVPPLPGKPKDTDGGTNPSDNGNDQTGTVAPGPLQSKPAVPPQPEPEDGNPMSAPP